VFSCGFDSIPFDLGAYMQVGRYADAAAAYRRALATDNEMMETPSGDTIWSHDVARKMLAHEVLLTAR